MNLLKFIICSNFQRSFQSMTFGLSVPERANSTHPVSPSNHQRQTNRGRTKTPPCKHGRPFSPPARYRTTEPFSARGACLLNAAFSYRSKQLDGAGHPRASSRRKRKQHWVCRRRCVYRITYVR